MKHLLLTAVLVWLSSSLLLGQSSNFIDSLYLQSFSELNNQKADWKLAEIKRLRRDFGLSVGASITNTYLNDDPDIGLSSRLVGRANMWRGGYKENLLNADILEKELQIDQIKGDQELQNHNYGLYFDYIIYLHNLQKIQEGTAILNKANELEYELNQLYYQKIIEYDEILEMKRIQSEYLGLMQTNQSYNDVFFPLIAEYELPIELPAIIWLLDFGGMANAIQEAPQNQELIALQHSIIDDQYEKSSLSNLSLAYGYDFTRKRPYYNINLTVPIGGPKKPSKNIEKQLVEEQSNIQTLQKQKELLNLQYEYEFKRKQFQHLQFKLERIAEKKRILQSKRNILSLEESLEEKRLELDSLLIQYELIETKQQSILLLLQIKKKIYPLNIEQFILDEWQPIALKKYPNERFILNDSKEQMTETDQNLLKINEINPISSEELIAMQNVVLVNPDQFENRGEMETFIQNLGAKSKFLITDLPSFKELELRTIRAKVVGKIR